MSGFGIIGYAVAEVVNPEEEHEEDESSEDE